MILGPGQGGDSPMFPVVWRQCGCPVSAGARPERGPSRDGRQGVLLPGQPVTTTRSGDHRRHPRNRPTSRTPETPWSRGGRPVNFDAETYKGRNIVERSFSVFKQWRAIATRYDKLALTYRAGVVLYAVVIWLRQ